VEDKMPDPIPPLVVFPSNSSLVFCNESLAGLCEANSNGLKSKPFDGMVIVDSGLRHLTVKSARIVRGRGPLGGYNIWLNRNVEVELELGPSVRQLELSDLKQMIRDRLQPETVEDYHHDDPRQFNELLSNAATFREICELIHIIP
jgi:hypothetical protein